MSTSNEPARPPEQSTGALAAGLTVLGVIIVLLAAVPLFIPSLRFWNQPGQPYRAGLEAMQAKNYDQAIEHFSEAIRRDPGYAAAYGARGDCYRYKKEWTKALSDMNRVIAFWPASANGFYHRALIHYDSRDYPKSITDLDETIRLSNRHDGAYNLRGTCFSRSGDYTRASADFQKAIELLPQSDLAQYPLNNFAWLLATCPKSELRDGKKAVELATRSCELAKWKYDAAIDTLAAACAEVGDFESAIKWESKYVEEFKLSDERMTEGRQRLALYQGHQPYRER